MGKARQSVPCTFSEVSKSFPESELAGPRPARGEGPSRVQLGRGPYLPVLAVAGHLWGGAGVSDASLSQLGPAVGFPTPGGIAPRAANPGSPRALPIPAPAKVTR